MTKLPAIVPGSSPPTEVFRCLFSREGAIERHSAAPLLKEREVYLKHLLERGNTRGGTRSKAFYLLHILRVLRLSQIRVVHDSEIKVAALQWAEEKVAHRKRRPDPKSMLEFSSTARGFLRFHGSFMPSNPKACRFDHLIAEFLISLHQGAGYAATTIASTIGPVRNFLFWLAGKHQSLLSIRPDVITSYLRHGRALGWQPRTVAAHCQALRIFFRFADSKGWCQLAIAETIRSPVSRRSSGEVIGPPWKEVRRMIENMPDTSAYDRRAKAILLLCSVYGLRSAEVIKLQLEDFDWQAETFGVKRAKKGAWQRFPIQFEVGEAILRYLQTGRPNSEFRNVFLTTVPPFRPLKTLAAIVQKQMQSAGILAQHYGPHSLRHSCATELLRQGTSLQQIAEFLGHRDIRSVSVYAKLDVRSLKEVANFSLVDVL